MEDNVTTQTIQKKVEHRVKFISLSGNTITLRHMTFVDGIEKTNESVSMSIGDTLSINYSVDINYPINMEVVDD